MFNSLKVFGGVFLFAKKHSERCVFSLIVRSVRIGQKHYDETLQIPEDQLHNCCHKQNVSFFFFKSALLNPSTYLMIKFHILILTLYKKKAAVIFD